MSSLPTHHHHVSAHTHEGSSSNAHDDHAMNGETHHDGSGHHSGLLHAYGYHLPRVQFWNRLRGKNRGQLPNFRERLNIFLIVIPFAWLSHFIDSWNEIKNLTFGQSLFEFGGEQMALYCGKVMLCDLLFLLSWSDSGVKTVGDLVVVTLNNSVEAALAIILLSKCELKLLQSTVTGVILLHVLLIPGVSFLAGGARIWQQVLSPHSTQLNHSLLTVGLFALLIPTAFFAAINPGFDSSLESTFISSELKDKFLRFSRGLAVILLLVYLCSRFFIFDPPGGGNGLVTPDAPAALREKERELAHEKPEVNPWFCMAFLIITVAIMATTAEFLVDSIEGVRVGNNITEEWFGVILLPLVSFSGDAIVAIVFFLKTALFLKPETPSALAKSEAIDMSIQFALFWLPFLVLLGWWTAKPLHLLFGEILYLSDVVVINSPLVRDLYEVALLIGACFLVNYVTADAKTNWAGELLIAFKLLPELKLKERWLGIIDVTSVTTLALCDSLPTLKAC
ncbi:hypothetical protein Clacol_008527 [Clathrus columnatus]|uniref:Sodium/calcium exchanger membrane region domain-containing protein n=1 Tax=Clathrus columnatus TaxID=1419009 RepID=A0AAV5ANM0_9AGAM|nr:hypothetical protein Clacol_008527 [Clathrus columnatus]